MIRRVTFSIVPLLVAGSVAFPVRAVLESSVYAQASEGAPEASLGTLTVQQATYRIFVRGVPIGSENLTVEREAEGWVITGSGRFETPLNSTLRQGEIRYGLDMRPQRLRLVGRFQDDSVDLTTDFSGGKAHATFVEDGETKESEIAVRDDVVIMPNNFFGAFAGLAARLAGRPPGTELRVYVSPQAEIPVVIDEVTTERLQTPARAFATRRYRITFRNSNGPLQAEIETEEDGKLVRVTVPGLYVQFAREDVASVASRQQLLSRRNDEDARIPANGFNLAATISRPFETTPPATSKKATRLPAIVLVPDAGPVDRDQVVAGIPIFGQLGANLADGGYLVVRYDKRGLGQSGGRTEAATLTDYADDVISIVKWVADRKDVDSKNIVLIGHGEGAWIALQAASREKRIDRVVLIAPAGTTGADLVLEQQRAALAKTTLSEAEKQQRVAEQKQIHAAVLKQAGWEGVPQEVRQQADTPWFASMLSFDPAPIVRRVRQPILLVVPERDTQIPAHHAETLAALARERKKDPGVTLVTIPGIDHLLVPAVAGEQAGYETLSGRTVSPEVATAITKWITPR